MKWGILLLCLCAAGCDDDDTLGDGGGHGDGGDLSANGDGGGGPDLFGADLTCSYGTFGGFPGVSPSERSFDCSCGCTLDSFQNPTQVNGFWRGSNASASWFEPSANGLEAVVDSSQSGPAIAGLASDQLTNQWYLAGDFDLLVDYEIIGAMPADGHAILQVNNLKMPADSTYTVERERTHAGTDQYTGTVGGITPVPVSVVSTSTSGTLELKRNGFVLQAIADGAMVTQYTGAVLDRMAVLVTAGQNSCALDGGAPVDGSVPGCRLTVRWKNLRLAFGVAVDRK